MWTNDNRGRYDRSGLRYPSDLTDDEWSLVEPLIPPGKRGGDKRTVIMREVVNGLMYILSTGCQWRAIPKHLPPRSTLYDYFDLWSWDGTLDVIHHGRCTDHGDHVWHVSVPVETLRRRRLSRSGVSPHRLENNGASECRDRQAFGSRERLCLPKRWVVERTFAWLGRCRRLAKDFENLNRKALAFLRLASIRLMLRKLCNPA
jgi:transposase